MPSPSTSCSANMVPRRARLHVCLVLLALSAHLFPAVANPAQEGLEDDESTALRQRAEEVGQRQRGLLQNQALAEELKGNMITGEAPFVLRQWPDADREEL